jgi:hypothetical protein
MSAATTRRYRPQRDAVVRIGEAVVASIPKANAIEAAHLQRAKSLLLAAALKLLDADHAADGAEAAAPSRANA